MKLTTSTFAIAAFATGVFGLATVGNAQTRLDLPYASQAAQVKQRVGVTDITITYHRPMVNGRKIWEGVVPMGKVWRGGGHENTKGEGKTPGLIEGKPRAGGTHSLYINSDTRQVAG